MSCDLTRYVKQRRGCKCQNECDGAPTPTPIGDFSLENNVGEHCFKQKGNGSKNGECRHLIWEDVCVIDPDKVNVNVNG